VTAIAGHPTAHLSARRWRDPAVWIATVDVLAILLALALPWSTSLVGIFAVLILLAMAPTLEWGALVRILKTPAAMTPLVLFLLAVVGTLWSDAAWGQRLHGISPMAKLVVLPVLLYHFQRSQRGLWVFIAFLVSCTLLEVMSWAVAFEPGLALKPHDYAERGIFVKDYIDQSQEFTLCAVALAFPVITLLRAKKVWQAVLLAAIGVSFIVNMTFVIVSRTALVTMPVMAAVFALMHLRWRTNVMIFAAAILVAAAAWVLSPQLKWTIETFSRDYTLYTQENVPTSIGERFEYWKTSLTFIAEAPLIGHGSGSSKGLFEQAAHEANWIKGVRVFPNPHNQTLNVAVQWGVMGIVVLYAMWLVHLLLFRGEGLANWIGLLVVVQNIFTSLFNSHISDFHEGWMYVLAVGVAGGMVLKTQLSGPRSDATGA
jgi:O-antigen ligase